MIMGKPKFPKEDPDIERWIEEAESLIRRSRDDGDALIRAFGIVSECADGGSPRALFIEACLLYGDENKTGEYKDEILAALGKAEKAKYPLAGGMKIDYVSAYADPDELYEVIRKTKGESPQSLYCMGGFFAGIDAPRGIKKNYDKAAEYFERSAEAYLQYDKAYRDGCRELADIALCYGNPDFFTSQAAYAYQMLMYVYSVIDSKANLRKYTDAYEKAQFYGNATVAYKTAASYATDCMDNVMGMHSLKTVNSLLDTAKKAWERLNDAQRERLNENYDSLWEKYDEFYEYEMRRLQEIGNMEIHTSADYAKQDSLLSDFASAVKRWSENRGGCETEYSVTIDGKKYGLNEFGEIVDEYGQGNGLRVDTTSRKVYDTKNDAVGFFDSFGEFHKY